MNFRKYENVYEFAAKAEPILNENEDVYSLFFGVLQDIKAGRYEEPFMATIEENGEVLALFQMTSPHPLNIIIVDESRLQESIDAAISHLLALGIEIPSIVSLKPSAYYFSRKWEEKIGLTNHLLMDQGLYRLDEVNETLEQSSGTWRFANEGDSSLIEKWFNLFEADSRLPITQVEEVKKLVSRFIEGKEIFLWEDNGEVVSMMKKTRPTTKGVTVSFVFTPSEKRRKGYARTLVAAASKELLKNYDFCVLYTDMMNPTSNKIYQEIGYKRIGESVQLGFKEN